jgi:methionyl-tRNA formyltransferase
MSTRIIMMGTGDFAVPSFRRLLEQHYPVVLLVTQPDRPRGRHQEVLAAPIKQLALERQIELFQPEHVNAPDAIARIAALRPDLLVVAAYGQILSDALLQASRLGGINLHASLLPRYRGAAPVNWAIYHGESVTGVSVIRITPRVDAGAILLQAETAIEPDETAGELEGRLAELGAPLVCRAIDGITAGTLHGRKQDKTRASRAPKLTKENGLIDWTRTAQGVCDQIRAMQPWPLAYTFWHRRLGGPAVRIIIERARVAGADGRAAPPVPPGTVVHSDAERLLVAAGDQPVSIVRLRPAGKRSMPTAQFLCGNPVQAGDRFGAESPEQ